MLNYFNNFAITRQAWLILFFSAFGLELTALYFQYAMGLEPCVMCIYQRTAILGIAIAGLIGSIAPQQFVCRVIAYIVWGYSSIRGLLLAIEHVEIQTTNSPFFSCDFRPNFPQWLQLDEIIPFFFRAQGDCADISWTFLNWSMSQWMIVVFSCFTATFLLILAIRFRPINQFKV